MLGPWDQTRGPFLRLRPLGTVIGDAASCVNLYFLTPVTAELFIHIPTIFGEEESMFWKIVLVLGILGLLLGIAVTGVSVALPLVSDGRTSWEEAMFGIIPGVIVLGLSFLVFIIGLIFVIKNRKRKVVSPGQFGQ